MSFSSTARRMQRFRQPQKMQGPLFPIEDNELIDAINDYKNILDEDVMSRQDSKTDTLFNQFDAESHVEVIEVDDIYMDNCDDIDENVVYNEKEVNDIVSKEIKKETENTVNMFCKLYYYAEYLRKCLTLN